MKKHFLINLLVLAACLLYAASSFAGRTFNKDPYLQDDLQVNKLSVVNDYCEALPLGAFRLETGGTAATVGTDGAVLNSSSTPNLLIDANGDFEYIVWEDGETTPIYINHSVPADQIGNTEIYYKVTFHQPLAGTPERIDYDVRINAENDTSWDSSVTNQTPVSNGGVFNEPQTATLRPTTDFATVSAGDMARPRFWRDNSSGTGTQNFEITAIKACYKNIFSG